MNAITQTQRPHIQSAIVNSDESWQFDTKSMQITSGSVMLGNFYCPCGAGSLVQVRGKPICHFVEF